MKRPVLHVLFWLFYTSICIFIEYLWEKATIPQYSPIELFTSSIKITLVEVLPEILFAYYITYYGLNKFVVVRRNILFTISEVLLVLFGCIVIDRIINIYFTIPYLYNNLIPSSPLLELRRVFVVLLYMMFASGFMVSIKSVRVQLASKEREKSLIKEKLEAELKFLRTQINPHFLFNTLNNIYGLTRKKSDKAPEVVMKLSELLSFMLYESGKESVTMAEEIKVLEDYIELERIRYNERLSIEFKKEVDNPSQPISPLLLLPLVENAFKHGVSETRFDSSIKIQMTLKDANLWFCIENSIENGKAKNSNSQIGLSNIRRQLELMYKEHSIDVIAERDIFKAVITINLNSYEKV
ncbi:MAG TPA: sensor histidine kinase [Flavitalea sp.]|nr:sensor histidine kinase [Flavitalea sp.]